MYIYYKNSFEHQLRHVPDETPWSLHRDNIEEDLGRGLSLLIGEDEWVCVQEAQFLWDKKEKDVSI